MIYRVKKQYFGEVVTEPSANDFDMGSFRTESVEDIRCYYAVQVRGLFFWHTVKVFETIRAAAEFLHELRTLRPYEI